MRSDVEIGAGSALDVICPLDQVDNFEEFPNYVKAIVEILKRWFSWSGVRTRPVFLVSKRNNQRHSILTGFNYLSRSPKGSPLSNRQHDLRPRLQVKQS